MTDVKLEDAERLAGEMDSCAEMFKVPDFKTVAALLRKIQELQKELHYLKLPFADIEAEFSSDGLDTNIAMNALCKRADSHRKHIAQLYKQNAELRQQLSEREWRDVSSAPEMRVILLYIVTDRDDDGKVRNWEIATGVLLSPDCRLYENETRWEWKGRRLKVWEYQPSHWMPLPGGPKS